MRITAERSQRLTTQTLRCVPSAFGMTFKWNLQLFRMWLGRFPMDFFPDLWGSYNERLSLSFRGKRSNHVNLNLIWKSSRNVQNINCRMDLRSVAHNFEHFASFIYSFIKWTLVLSTYYIPGKKLDALENVANMLLREIPKMELNSI